MGGISGAELVWEPNRERVSTGSSSLPTTWRRHFVPQRHADYSSRDHDTWKRLLERTAELVHDLNPWLHASYMEGFRRLILPWSRIPSVPEINEALAEFGWSATCVDGYLPPNVYAGLMARGVFPISRTIRDPEHLDFSPLPDLAHDLLGHLPMLVSREHRLFLQRLSMAMANAEHGKLDDELYLANHASATLRCQPDCPAHKREAAASRVARIQRALGKRPSAMTALGRLYLWSIEFGLMGTPDEFRVYGAGLLSSPTETRAVCMKRVPIRDFTLAAVRRDIHFSDLQSVYFVAADYAQLERVLSTVQCRLSSIDERARQRDGALHRPGQTPERVT